MRSSIDKRLSGSFYKIINYYCMNWYNTKLWSGRKSGTGTVLLLIVIAGIVVLRQTQTHKSHPETYFQ
jgi:hypothetical protein